MNKNLNLYGKLSEQMPYVEKDIFDNAFELTEIMVALSEGELVFALELVSTIKNSLGIDHTLAEIQLLESVTLIWDYDGISLYVHWSEYIEQFKLTKNQRENILNSEHVQGFWEYLN
ncbi:hypothetical protein AN944_02309 [Shewanella sp. P1-14-1]|uniref:hypothetical protein n=1 Tax=Shewanella sp. P1-14-1 TaxID=1723761 RepID=UPI0006D675AA|nr:hypothetical protein [Shewanella sp. P1-14-1]KPZ70237.1 hypothetical protein AN944_02309 [Shewanella sp. P1-14-1]